MRSKSNELTATSPAMAEQIPFCAWETGVSLTTSAGLRVIAEAACDMSFPILHTGAKTSRSGATYYQSTEPAQARFLSPPRMSFSTAFHSKNPCSCDEQPL